MARTKARIDITAQDKTRQAFNSVQRSMTGLNRSALRLGGLLGAALGARGLLRQVSDASKAFDNLASTADKLGVGVERFQELQFAAEQTNVKIESFNVGFQRFTRRTAEAAAGNKELRKVFDQLGISLTDTAGRLKSNDQVFNEFADAIQKVDNQAERVRLTFKLFDTEGVDLVRLLQLGSRGIRDFTQRAREMGAVIDEGIVRNAAEGNTQLTAMRRIIDLQLKSTLVSLTPILLTMAGALAKAADGAGQLFDRLRDIEDRQNIRGLQAEMLSTQKLAARLQAQVAETLNEGGDPSELQKELDRLRDRSDRLIARMKELKVASDAATSGGGGFVPPPPPVPKPRQDFSELDRISAIFEKMDEEELARVAKTQARLRDIYDQTRTPVERLQIELEELNRLAEDHPQHWDAIARAMEQAQDAYDRTQEKVEETQDKLSTFADQAARNMQDAFADFLFDPFDQGLKGMLDSFVITLRQMAAQAAATKIFEQIGGANGGILGSLFDFIGLRASGGPVLAGAPYIVGERGPELMIPQQSGRVVANNQVGAGNVTVNVTAPTQASGQSPAQFGYEIGRAIQTAMRRNG